MIVTTATSTQQNRTDEKIIRKDLEIITKEIIPQS